MTEQEEKDLKESFGIAVSEILEERFGIVGKHVPGEEIPDYMLSPVRELLTHAKEVGREEERKRVNDRILAFQEGYDREDQKPIRIVLGNLWHSLNVMDSPPQQQGE